MPDKHFDTGQGGLQIQPEDEVELTEEVHETELVGAAEQPPPPDTAWLHAGPVLGSQNTVTLPTNPPAPPVDVLANRGEVDAPVARRSVRSELPDDATQVLETQTEVANSYTSTPGGGVTSTEVFERSEEFQDLISSDQVVLADATVLPTVPSRAGARWLSGILITLLAPITWYLLSDAGARLAFATDNPWETGVINPGALIELGGGIALLILIAVIASQSGLGLIISGILFTLVSLPFLAVPAMTQQAIDSYLGSWKSPDANPLLGNVVRCLEATGFTGILLSAGVAMLLAGIVAATSRRAGRKEEATRVMVVSVNPDGVKARWAKKSGR